VVVPAVPSHRLQREESESSIRQMWNHHKTLKGTQTKAQLRRQASNTLFISTSDHLNTVIFMRDSIFTEQEREALESFLVHTRADQPAISRILKKMDANKILFEDVYLYLKVKKMMGK
jgi:hypothetical protein